MTKISSASSRWLALGGALAAAVGLANCGGSTGGARTGTGGSGGGTGGSTGAGGSSGGSGGSTGTGGTAGADGGTTTTLSCTTPYTPAMPLLSDFSSTTWNATIGKWGTSGNLMGSIFDYKGPLTTAATATPWNKSAVANGALTLGGTVIAGDYAGGGMSFDTCVNTTTYTGFQFTLGGSTGGCDLFIQVQTFSQQAISNHGGCDTNAGSCYSFPKLKIEIGTAPIVVHFSDLTGGMPTDPAAIAAEMIGLQWQLQSAAPPDGGTQTDCTAVSMTIDDVQFVGP